jgi:hypothetical protein
MIWYPCDRFDGDWQHPHLSKTRMCCDRFKGIGESCTFQRQGSSAGRCLPLPPVNQGHADLQSVSQSVSQSDLVTRRCSKTQLLLRGSIRYNSKRSYDCIVKVLDQGSIWCRLLQGSIMINIEDAKVEITARACCANTNVLSFDWSNYVQVRHLAVFCKRMISQHYSPHNIAQN